MPSAYPLDWPPGWGRTERRRSALFKRYGTQLSLSSALDRLLEELRPLRVANHTVSTNLKTRLDGLPKSGQRIPDDPGVAVYFKLKDRDYCLPCDRWDRIEDNIAAIAAHLRAMRGQERWGVGDLERAFTGYAALPAPEAETPWWEVLGMTGPSIPLSHAKAQYTLLAKTHHPDRPGGSAEKMAELNRAIAMAREELGG